MISAKNKIIADLRKVLLMYETRDGKTDIEKEYDTIWIRRMRTFADYVEETVPELDDGALKDAIERAELAEAEMERLQKENDELQQIKEYWTTISKICLGKE